MIFFLMYSYQYNVFLLVLFQKSTIKNPVIAPPRWAKWATLSPLTLLIPLKRSIATYPITAHFALIGTGINMIKSSVLGNKNAKPTNTPITAPEAPTAYTGRSNSC